MTTDDVLAKLEGLSDAKIGAPGLTWDQWQDDALLKFWPVKRQVDVAKTIGVSVNACRRRFEELTR